MSTPNPLPKWLPPGTIARHTSGNTYIAKTTCELRGPGYYAIWDGSCVDGETWCQPDCIDWENIPDTGPRGRMENHDGVELYVPVAGELVRVISTEPDTESFYKVGEVITVTSASVSVGDTSAVPCLLVSSAGGDKAIGTYCFVEPFFDLPPPAPKKAFDLEAWERARAEAEAAFGDAPAVEGPSGVMIVNGQAYELKDCQLQVEDNAIDWLNYRATYTTLEDAVRAKGFQPGEQLVVNPDYSLQPAAVGIAVKAIPAGALVERDKNGNLVPVTSAASPRAGRVTRIKRP